MSTQFYSVPPVVQNAMGGTHLHTPQSIFQHTMNQSTSSLQNEAQWLGMPQTPPMSMPWSIPTSQQPNVVHFKGSQMPVLEPFCRKSSYKRKLETFDRLVDTRPVKQLITEEKMAQHFRELHISPNTINTQEPGPSTSTVNNQDLNQLNNIDADFVNPLPPNQNSSEPRLFISDEVKKLQQEPILPSALLTQSISKLERPSMALVLWEPPSRQLRFFPRDTPTPVPSDSNNNNGMNTDNEVNNENNNNGNNNNNESIPDLNHTMDAHSSDLVLEPMDL